MPINLRGFTIPFKKPIERLETAQTKRAKEFIGTLENLIDLREEQKAQETEPEQIRKIEEAQLNYKHTIALAQGSIDAQEVQAGFEQTLRNEVFNQRATAGVAAGAQIVVQAIRNTVSTIGIRTGNVIRQERLERSLGFAAQAVGIAASFAVNPILGATAATNFITNSAIREYTAVLERQRITKDNALKMELVGGIAERGNR